VSPCCVTIATTGGVGATADACLAGGGAAGSVRAPSLDGSLAHAQVRRSAQSTAERQYRGGMIM
jgi:hypothetical protein